MFDPNTSSSQSNLALTLPQAREQRRSAPRGTLLFFLIIFLVCGATALELILDKTGSTLPFVLELTTGKAIALFAGLGCIIFLISLFRMARTGKIRTREERVIRALALAIFLGGLNGFFFWAFLINPYVGMAPTGFARTDVTITQGDAFHFENPSDGVAQVLCIGYNHVCQSVPGAPDALNNGMTIQPGQMVSIEFPETGDYAITSKTTLGMNLTVHVSSDEGGLDY